MSLSKRVSLQPPSGHVAHDLKHRVITCLNKLSDRDTLAVASLELESIAVTLNHESFAPFISYLSATTSSDKSPVRKQCVRILGFLSETHGNTLSPHITKMLSTVVRRLRDSDSAVRSACIAAVTSIASEITNPSFSTISKPLIDAVMTEQDHNAQVGSGLCLSAAIEAAPDPEPAQLQKLLPRVLKLIKSDGFKAKPALLNVIGSIVGAGGGNAFNRSSLGLVVNCLVEFLSSEDWAARKAAVEALGRLAVAEKVRLSPFRAAGLASLENRRFDKVKVVRESMNQTLELWKEIPGHQDEVPASPSLNDSSSSKVAVLETSPKETLSISKQSPAQRSSPTTTPQSRSPPKSNYRKHSVSVARKMEYFDQETNAKVNAYVPVSAASDTMDTDKNIILETEKRVVSNKSRFGSRPVSFVDDECELYKDGNPMEHVYENQREVEDLSRIQKQLVQIENQQSNLLNLLQKSIGSSRNGMNSLETRVNGLERALDEMSYDLALSTGRVSSSDSCCMGTEYLSLNSWWRAEVSFSNPRSPFRANHQYTPGNEFGNPGRRFETLLSARKQKATQGQNHNFDRFDGGSLASYIH
ncbi:TORTIFOLIA1-like protein 5 [Bidens hawaiensis]|uniref:TORTIFOLIA1-like protein 5 n=1 Tax=Bidens hawaiensis TaxID=980011 RepID=UPI00404B1DE9